MPRLIPALRLLDAAHFTSGKTIAERLGVSRASISTTLARAEEYGVVLERRHGAGYRLARLVEWLDAAMIAREFDAKSVLALEIVNQAESTNRALLAAPRQDYTRRLLAAVPRGLAGRAERTGPMN